MSGRTPTIQVLDQLLAHLEKVGKDCVTRESYARSRNMVADVYWYSGQAAGLREAHRVVGRVRKALADTTAVRAHVNADNRGQTTKGVR